MKLIQENRSLTPQKKKKRKEKTTEKPTNQPTKTKQGKLSPASCFHGDINK